MGKKCKAGKFALNYSGADEFYSSLPYRMSVLKCNLIHLCSIFQHTLIIPIKANYLVLHEKFLSRFSSTTFFVQLLENKIFLCIHVSNVHFID